MNRSIVQIPPAQRVVYGKVKGGCILSIRAVEATGLSIVHSDQRYKGTQRYVCTVCNNTSWDRKRLETHYDCHAILDQTQPMSINKDCTCT